MKNLRYVIRQGVNAIFQLRSLLAFMILFVASEYYIGAIRQTLCGTYTKINFVLIPFFCQQLFYLLVLGIVVVFYFSDIPFMQRKELFYIVRQGRKDWAKTQIFNIYFRSIFLTTLLYLLVLMLLGKHCDFGCDWDDAAYMLTNSSLNLSFFTNRSILNQYTPYHLWVSHTLVLLLIVSAIGLLMYAISLWLNRACAILAGGMCAVFPIITDNIMNMKYYFISVGSWLDFTKIGARYGEGKPMLEYVIAMLLLMHIFTIWLILSYVEKTDFIWEDERI